MRRRLAHYLIPLVSLFAIVGMLRVLEAGTTLSGLVTLPSPTMIQPGAILTGQALRLGETTTVDPRTGTGVQRPVASFLYARDGASAYFKTASTATGWETVAPGTIGAGTSESGRVARAAQLTGIASSSLTCWRDDWIIGSNANHYTFTLSGSGTQALSTGNSVGGVQSMATGATAASQSTMSGLGTIFGRTDTTKSYWSSRFALTTAIDAQTGILAGMTNVGSTGSVAIGACGTAFGGSNANFVVYFDGSQACLGGTHTSTGQPVDTNKHTFEMWFLGDGKVHYAIDALEVSGSPFTMAAAPAVSMKLYYDVRNGSTAANRAADIDWTMFCWSET